MNVGSMRQGILAYPLLMPVRPFLVPVRRLLMPCVTRNLMRALVKPAMRARGARDEGKRNPR